jgi:DNA repair protein RadC
MNNLMTDATFRRTKPGRSLEQALPMNTAGSANSTTPKQPLQRIQRFRKWLILETVPLADSEVLEMILDPFVNRRKPGQVARALLDEFGTLRRTVHAPAADLMAIEGMEEAGVAALKAVAAAARHMLPKAAPHGPRIRTWDDLTGYVTARLQIWRAGVPFAVFLDNNDLVIEDQDAGPGGLDQAPACPREVVRRSLELNAASIILVHDRPDNMLILSQEDYAKADDIAWAARTIGVVLRDHVVMGRKDCFSCLKQRSF